MVLGDLTTYLQSQGIGVAEVDLFYGIMLETPDACVTLLEYGGLPNEPVLGGLTTNLEYPSIQVLCRGVANDYDGPRLKAQQVVTAMALISNTLLTSAYYKAVMPKQAPFFLKRDENFRVIFACNYAVTKTYSTT